MTIVIVNRLPRKSVVSHQTRIAGQNARAKAIAEYRRTLVLARFRARLAALRTGNNRM